MSHEAVDRAVTAAGTLPAKECCKIGDSVVGEKVPMTTFDTLIKLNKDFAAHHFLTSSSLKPTLEGTLRSAKALIIACADPRDDPAYVLGFEPGEAVVLRNIGGRITPGTLQ